MHLIGYISAMTVAFFIGVNSGKTVDSNVPEIEPLPGNYFVEEIIGKKYCTDKWGNTILATRIRSAKTTITE